MKVRTDMFGVCKDNVKVYLRPINRHGQTKRWWEAKRNMNNLQEQRPTKDSFGRKEKSIFIHGYLIIELEGKDR